MKLDKNYTLESDKNNWILSYKSDEKTNEKGEKYHGTYSWYYPSLKDALQKYMDECLKPCESVEELFKELIKLKHRISTIKNQ